MDKRKELCVQLRKLDPGSESTSGESQTYPQRISSFFARRRNWIAKSKPDPEPQNSQLRWSDVTMISAFFVVMEGFAFDVSDLSDDIEYLALTSRGCIDFAKAGLIIPNILENRNIADRSKADSLGKVLVCVQALWMVVNCVARKASGLPTTLVS